MMPWTQFHILSPDLITDGTENSKLRQVINDRIEIKANIGSSSG